MKKEVYFFGIIFLVLSIGIVSAVWWNPWTWGEKDSDNNVMPSLAPDPNCPYTGNCTCADVGPPLFKL